MLLTNALTGVGLPPLTDTLAMKCRENPKSGRHKQRWYLLQSFMQWRVCRGMLNPFSIMDSTVCNRNLSGTLGLASSLAPIICLKVLHVMASVHQFTLNKLCDLVASVGPAISDMRRRLTQCPPLIVLC